MTSLPDWDARRVAQVLSSFSRWLGQPLVTATSEHAAQRWLYEEAPFCLVAHDGAADPCFWYANAAAQRCFEYSWEELVGMPSRLSAEPDARSEREALLQRVTSRGYAQGYRGVRVAKSGRRFWIEDVTIWNVLDERGEYLGQAAVYRDTSPA